MALCALQTPDWLKCCLIDVPFANKLCLYTRTVDSRMQEWGSTQKQTGVREFALASTLSLTSDVGQSMFCGLMFCALRAPQQHLLRVLAAIDNPLGSSGLKKRKGLFSLENQAAGFIDNRAWRLALTSVDKKEQEPVGDDHERRA